MSETTWYVVVEEGPSTSRSKNAVNGNWPFVVTGGESGPFLDIRDAEKLRLSRERWAARAGYELTYRVFTLAAVDDNG